nr:glycosyltransferase family 52 [Parabacteroides goldsteinii]
MKLFRKYKAIAYLPTPYTLLQYYLLEPYRIEDTLFLFHGGFPLSVVHRVSGAKVLDDKNQKKCYGSLLQVYWYALRNRNIPVYLGGWLFFSNLFLRLFKHIFYLEDGTASYEAVLCPKFQSFKREKVLWRRWLRGNIYPQFGLAENVECIYLTGILPIPDIISNKVKIIDLYALWQQKNPDQKKEIVNVFLPQGFDSKLFDSCDTLLLTQPFSEYSAGDFTESDKIEVYRRLLAGYDESKVLIKVHPRETTDYAAYFPSAKILAIPCPMELLVLQGIPLHRAITVNSTAVYNLGDQIEKIITGYDVTPALIEEAKRRNIYDGISNKLVTKQV